MLPNWLLGKSKSKLQEILGGGGGGTTYTAGDGIDISNGVISFDPATTPVIDPSKVDGLDDDLAALTPKTALSNPNILHNPWFTVNQRGANSYSTGGYCVDRWYYFGQAGNVLVSNNVLTLPLAEQSQTNIYQKLTDNTLEHIRGKKVTLSVLFSNDVIKSTTKTVPAGDGNFTLSEKIDTDNNLYLDLYYTAGSYLTFRFIKWDSAACVDSSISIKAFKLELGEISTLAMDPRPEYALELAKCQRYYQRFNSKPSESLILGLGVATAPTAGSCTIFLPSAMRATPTLRLPNTFSVVEYASGTTITGSSLVINNLESNILQLNATWSESITTGEVIGIQLLNTAYLALDADL